MLNKKLYFHINLEDSILCIFKLFVLSRISFILLNEKQINIMFDTKIHIIKKMYIDYKLFFSKKFTIFKKIRPVLNYSFTLFS